MPQCGMAWTHTQREVTISFFRYAIFVFFSSNICFKLYDKFHNLAIYRIYHWINEICWAHNDHLDVVRFIWNCIEENYTFCCCYLLGLIWPPYPRTTPFCFLRVRFELPHRKMKNAIHRILINEKVFVRINRVNPLKTKR